MSFEYKKPLVPNDSLSMHKNKPAQRRRPPSLNDPSMASVPALTLGEGHLNSCDNPRGHTPYSGGHIYGQKLLRPSIGRALTDSSNFIPFDDQEQNPQSPTVGQKPGVVDSHLGVDQYSLDSDDDNYDNETYKLNTTEDLTDLGTANSGPLSVQFASMSVDETYKRRQEEWAERGAAKLVKDMKDPETGKITRQVIKKGIKDFKFGEALGDGSYSTVVLATSVDSGKKYAAKILNKEYLIRQKKVKYVNIEKNTLQRLNSNHVPGIIKLFFTFQDEANLYFLLEYAPNGDFLSIMKKYGSLNEECARYYGAQILNGIYFLHRHGIIHRDIKPENILLDKSMKVKLTDFGTAKLLNRKDGTEEYDLTTRSKSFVGTAEYVSPELLNDSWVDHKCDIWAFGCILFQMIAGKPPFKATNEYLTFQKVMKVQYAFTAGFPMVVRDLVKQILVKKPEHRLTIPQIEKHLFFSDINFRDGSLWSAAAPEIAPYKVTAKAMQSIPALKDKANNIKPMVLADSRGQTTASKSGGPSSPVFPETTKQQQQQLLQQNVSPNSNSNPNGADGYDSYRSNNLTVKLDPQTARILEHARNEIMERKNQARSSSASSSAATVALYRRKPSNDSSNNLSSGSSRSATQRASHSAPAHNFSNIVAGSSAGSTTPKSTPNSAHEVKPTSSCPQNNIKSIPPLSKVDILWSYYLLKMDERVIRMGEIKMAIVKNQDLEKRVDKVRGVMVESSKAPTKATLLSQVVRNGGHNTGFRSPDKVGSHLIESDYYSESVIIWDNVKEEYKEKLGDDLIDIDRGLTASKIRKLFSGIRTDDTADLLSMDNYINKMVVITTFGRCLVFVRTIKASVESNLFFELQYEINLSLPGVNIKEIMTDGNDPFGTFVIQTPFNSFVFNCPQHELDIWTNSLNKSVKKNYERIVLANKEEPPSEVATVAARLTVGRNSGIPKTPSISVSCSPKTYHSVTPVKHNDTVSQPNTPNANYNSAPVTPALQQNSDGKHERLFESFINRKNYEKQPVQPVPHSSALVHGLPAASSHVRSMTTHRNSEGSLYPPSSRIKGSSSRMFTRSERAFRK
ncbi:PDPK1 family serine/threonine-protein kinase Ecym_3586 [Eremothecium cymbalariae DBVPG|uniref:non-specific serine/threonine protein kinase n=1 Tax=Eremothecium cymbalariae (strain CBS 270.75 / DBVPG 7215 / KCTC 17166 / NRRL Y-17582) TaxID=931890 RepID=G8JQR9_ERECY|nr:Hypothetical protein Ecym_3586 [Eremothecium cymbalariae DBVPG\